MTIWIAALAAGVALAGTPVVPVTDCGALSAADISQAAGAPAHITSAALSGAYCKVEGYIEPAVRFEVRMPTKTWTGRYVQTGCGGLCGSLNIRLDHSKGCAPADNGELALASTDMGHVNTGPEGAWGADPQRRTDFAYRGVHVTALAAKALITRYYGQPPKYSYFSGCSDGGREALIEAQRYPQDFDGIAAGAPAMNFVTQNTFYHGWNARVNTGADGQPVLTAEQMPILHQAALAACDMASPSACKFDPARLVCDDRAKCLTAEQARVAKEIYRGAHDDLGNQFVISGPMPGSELGWPGVIVPRRAGERTMGAGISTGTLKYLAYRVNPPDSFTLADFKFDRASFDATTRLHSLYDATDPDLRPFAKRGGKLIMWHGWADQHISPLNSIAYHTAVERTLGASAASKLTRLYLFPGGAHCSGGEGPFEFDVLSPLIAWVETGTAPGAITASKGSLQSAIKPYSGSVPASRLAWSGAGFYTSQHR